MLRMGRDLCQNLADHGLRSIGCVGKHVIVGRKVVVQGRCRALHRLMDVSCVRQVRSVLQIGVRGMAELEMIAIEGDGLMLGGAGGVAGAERAPCSSARSHMCL